MRIALLIFGALAAGYLIIKGFKQMLAEHRQDNRDTDAPRLSDEDR